MQETPGVNKSLNNYLEFRDRQVTLQVPIISFFLSYLKSFFSETNLIDERKKKNNPPFITK